ncbi:single-stranded-DNA-specific exonuclease RecJ [Candidatus Roizmanbacteria bacterium CG07_land_8_20_14_0_80_34_15]|uniref:Single-stranded-DNA-specific exonuclease RecJ n=1 Tax=Candidatus Roizmanbacteria bacterium CG07_land_8_20_14_0_80_34_15 TaxID=1974849 RepID=A0A2M6YU18_9BACT|nr:MAG: single-stranded-DNA-specific exonuclease RecJ [Candidatus Roizmanbacteria bacterium CG07_land_8_20_14_0_80_34_15]
MKITYKNEIKPQDKLDPKNIVNLILKSRNIKDLDQFLNPPSPLTLSLIDFGPYKKPFEKVINILKEIKEKNQMIVVYTDYDADGITGGAVLWETLHLLGFKVRPYVPDRKTEGYGYSKKGIDNCIKQFNPSLIITVDHGITKIKEVEYAKLKNIKTIITDHHLKGDNIPKAEAIFHIPALSGSGVAYFFAKEIFLSFGSKTTNYKLLTTNFRIDYLVLAAIGTIADLVPLAGPSRSVVKYGLDAFPKIKRFGIKHILKQAGIADKKITPYEVGFMIAPRINAIGRLEHAIDALRLLCTNDEKKAFDLAHKIGNINIERQEMVEKSVVEARIMISKNLLQNKLLTTHYPLPTKLIILVSDHWHEGIIGLIASKIAEEFYRPTLVLTKTDIGYKGSARSIPSFHITEFLRSLKEYIIDAGGHKQAAGFTLEKNQLYNFETAAQELSSKLISDKDLERKIEADLKIPISKINLELVESLSSLEPFGIGNPRPVFYSEGILTGAQLLGKTQKHLKLFISGLSNQVTHNQASIEFLAFNSAEKFKDLSRGQKIKVVYNLDINEWNNKKTVQGKIVTFVI